MERKRNFHPAIRVQLVHIAGPRKGDIDEFTEEQINIGRGPSSHVLYPASLRIVSREHAQIVREGNRYLLRNISKNGSLVNGEQVQQTYLKQGDVITFAPGGPKVSFLYAVDSSARPPPRTMAPHDDMAAAAGATQTLSRGKLGIGGVFTLQYASSVRSFELAGITLGRQSDCDFVIDHHQVADRHAYLYFADHECYVHSLTQSPAISVNGKTLQQDTALRAGDRLSLSPGGPQFRYLGDGKLVELKPQNAASDEATQAVTMAVPQARRRGLLSLIKSLLGR